jgi:hypothetical protein
MAQWHWNRLEVLSEKGFSDLYLELSRISYQVATKECFGLVAVVDRQSSQRQTVWDSVIPNSMS